MLLVAFALAVSTAIAQHPAINLLDANGDIIDPINDDNAGAPFSTRQTCGLCHDYQTITEGYHFQMGWNKVADDFGAESGRPWSLSDGFAGRWYPYAFRQLAKKVNHSADDIDVTVYDFVGFSSPGRGEPPCGACHPGGGLEFDRSGNRYDEHLASNPELAETFDGDYFRSACDASGVVEADCLICHLKEYDFDARVDQLRQGNYRGGGGGRLQVRPRRRFGTAKKACDRPLRNAPFQRRRDDHPRPFLAPPDDNCVYCRGDGDKEAGNT